MRGRAPLVLADLASLPGRRRPALSPWLAAALLALLPAARAAATCVALLCSGDGNVPNDSNQCGAVVAYGAPTPVVIGVGGCGTIVCGPASGSFFPAGVTTTVTCTATAGPSCTFGVAVADVQAPQITPPPDVNVVGTMPGEPLPVSFPAPTASDNCPGVVTNCSPPSGSAFPSGLTPVTCTATDAFGNTASGSFGVAYFDACVQDDATGDFLRWRTSDGAYEVYDCGDSSCGQGDFVHTGVGQATPTGAGFALSDRQDDRSVRASLQTGKGKGSAKLKFMDTNSRLSLKVKDAQISDDSCSCDM